MDESKQISEFNESMFQIQRLHNHWLEFDKFIKRGDFSKARWELDSVESELYWDAKRLDDDGRKELDKEEGFMNQLINSNKILQGAFYKGYLNIIYTLLRSKERLLREIQQESGKGARYKDADEDGLL